jgi:hypothetical protein
MSEAMTNSEIEDVLSSIRRLVAQDAKPPVDRLVLTAEHRVAPAEPPVELPDAPAIEAVRTVTLEPAGPPPGATPQPPGTDSPDSAARVDAEHPEAAAAPRERVPAEPEDTLIDEAELARLIARLVREELHGQLGEKITLQVRKLVRAEIARALDERNLLG